jgi:hypothetical protein
MLSVAYPASAGHWLPGSGVAGPYTNQIPVKYLPLQGTLSSTLNATTRATVQGMFPSFKHSVPELLRDGGPGAQPFPQYRSISDPWLDVGDSTYNALRLSQGLTFMFNYSSSKELDDLVGVCDPNKDFREKGPGTIDHPIVVAVIFLYQLPFGAATS